MIILVTGAKGLVGSHFIEHFALKGVTVLLPAQNELNITNQKSVEDFLNLNKPDVIIHFAAFTDVSLAEKQRNNRKAPCWIINVEGTVNLISAANPEAYFIYISTDVVFPGNKDNPGPYQEDDLPGNNLDLLSWYGQTKLEAENIVKNNKKNAVILRISNPVRARYKFKLDYVRKILALYDQNRLYPMFNDQYLTLTYVNEVTATIEALLKMRLTGIFHTSSINVFTPYKLANLLIEKSRGKKGAILPISIESFLNDNPSRYPQYGGLKVEKTQKRLGLNFKRWEEIIDVLAKQL